ncbi:hypothetical protein ACQY0O_002091 [Thecaphora frezii]
MLANSLRSHLAPSVHLRPARLLRLSPFDATAPLRRSSQSRCSHSLGTAPDGSGANRGADDSQSRRNTDAESIFPASRASARPNPHAAPLFGSARAKRSTSSPNRNGRSQKATKAEETAELGTLRTLTQDPALKQLYTELSQVAYRHNVIAALDICDSIRRHVAAVSPDAGASASSSAEPSTSSNIPLLPEAQMRGVYGLLLRCFAHHGLIEEANAVLQDMQRCNVTPDVEMLNLVLKAAVMRGDAHAIDEVLDQIGNLPGPSDGAEAAAKEAPPPPPPVAGNSVEAASRLFFDHVAPPDVTEAHLESPLSKDYTRNWTSTTYTLMLLSAKASHSAEQALALLAACLRDGVTLEHEALRHVIDLCLHVGECRVAVELALESEQGGLAPPASQDERNRNAGRVPRRLAPSRWMAILRACAEKGYLPGAEVAWQKAVIEGLLVPEEGLLLRLLNVASAHGSVSFCVVLLRHIYPGFDRLLETGRSDGGRPGKAVAGSSAKNLVLQEWHLAPLFEAQCLHEDFGAAIRTLSIMKRCGHPLSQQMVSRLTQACYTSEALLERACSALLDLGSTMVFGVDVSAVNAVITAAIWRGKMDLAVSIYERSWDLYDAVQDLARHPNDAVAAAAVEPYHAKQRKAQRQGGGGDGSQAGVRLRPNLETFHSLFSGCIDVKNRELGGRLIADLNALALKPTVLTYERMVLLCLTQTPYEDAFGFMEQAKLNGLRPSRKSYEGVVRKCHSVNDERWKWALEEMKEAGFYPNRRLCRELGIEYEEQQAQ